MKAFSYYHFKITQIVYPLYDQYLIDMCLS